MSLDSNRPPAGADTGSAPHRGPAARAASAAPLALLLLTGLLLRLNNVGFGLPSLYDPDEPLFMVKAAGLLQNHSLNPHWFGHPATTTIYLTSLIQAGVYLSGLIAGRFSSLSDFVHAAYADPAIVWIPVRIAMAILGTIAVGLTYLLGKRLFGKGGGLLAGLLLALNGLHIAWSQVVRSDVQASDFMLGALLLACRLGETGRRKHAIWAGLLTGFAVATKWPAVTAFAGVAGAAVWFATSNRAGWREGATLVAIAGVALLAGLFIASPFLILDYQTVLSNLAGEARPIHVGHTGNGFLSNLWTYLAVFAAHSMGWLGLALAAAGAVFGWARSAAVRYILVPAMIAFFISIAAPHLVWSRWLIPGLPYLVIFAAAGVLGVGRLVGAKGTPIRAVALGAVAALTILPSAIGAVGQARERQNDTRAQAAQWIITHAPRGSTIVLEHLELSLRNQPYRFLFPMGRSGCRDARGLLTSAIGYDDLEAARSGSPVVDLGNVGRDRIGSCRADFAVLSYYDLYIREKQRFPAEIATYRQLLEGGRTVALFQPKAGAVGGPIVRIVALPQQVRATGE